LGRRNGAAKEVDEDVGEAWSSDTEVSKVASGDHPAGHQRCHREQNSDDGNDLSSQEKSFESKCTGEVES